MMANKILGYVLLAVGLVIIGWVLWQSYNIFTARVQAPLVFKTPAPQQSASSDSKSLEQQLQAQMNQAIQKQLGQIIAPDSITKILNLIAWSIFAWILIMTGGAIAGIGVKLIK